MVKASAQYTIAEIHEECNVVISNESHVFRADKNNTVIADSVTIQVYGYQGNTQIATTIGTISGKPSAGMTTTINNNGKINTSITVAVTTALTSSIANNGVLIIPVTVAGKTFNKTFSWSKAQTGATGATGDTGAAARTYWVTSSANTITRSMKGTLTPTTITFSSYYRDGTSATSTAYAGRFIIQESTDGATWTTKYTSSANESSKVYTPTKTTNLVKCTMYAAGGTTNKLDELAIGIIDSIDDLEIGGRNLALKTKTYESLGNQKLYRYFTIYSSGTSIVEREDGFNEIRVSNQWSGIVTKPEPYNFKHGDKITLSVNVDAVEASGSIDFCLMQFDANATRVYNNISINGYLQTSLRLTSVKSNSSTRVACTFIWDEILNELLDSGGNIDITMQVGSITKDTDNGYISFYAPKLEYGTISTDWTPAPEDTDDRITQVEGDLTGKYNDLVNNDIATINDKLAQEIADTETMKEDLGVISQQATTLVSLVDENEKKTQTLTQTVSNMLLSGESLDISFDRTKGVNLLKNSVMQQHKTAVASGVIKADFWLNKNLEEDYFLNVYYNEEALVRKTTVCGNSFQIRTKTTDEVKYDFILSSPIDLKENVENLLLAYKIKGNISAGNCFVGLVFYKHLIDQPNGLSFTSSSSNPYITNAYYVPINCYSAAEGTNIKKINASFTQDYIYKTMPLATPEAHVTKEVNETLVAEEGQIELTYLPQTGSNIVLVSPSGVQGAVGASDSRLVTLPAALLEETIVTATYNRSIETFKTATSTTDAQTKTNSMPNTETTICYNPSSKKIYVYNPFTKSYYLSNNLYDNTSSSSNIDTVRVIIGICGATISSDFIGNVEIADLKLEYDSTSIYWTQNLDESYSKKYRMDEKGFSISSDQNMMFIDENQIAAYQLEETTTVEGETIKEPDLDNPVFQISGAETQLQKTIIYDELKISNRTKSEDGAFVFKQLQTESGDWYFLFY